MMDKHNKIFDIDPVALFIQIVKSFDFIVLAYKQTILYSICSSLLKDAVILVLVEYIPYFLHFCLAISKVVVFQQLCFLLNSTF